MIERLKVGTKDTLSSCLFQRFEVNPRMSSLVQKTIDNGFWRLKNAFGHDKFDNEVFCAERPNGIIDY